MEVTEEMRAAVLAAECARWGHEIDIAEAISNDPTVHPDDHTVTIRARTDDTIPHLRCRRCPTVWLIVEGVGGYDAAEEALNERLAAKHRRRLRREVRAERAARQAEKAAAAEERSRAAAAASAPAADAPTPALLTPQPMPEQR